MHLLYLDDSGSASHPTQQYFVLAGLSVFERSTHWIEQELNQVASRFARDPDCPYDIELHASPMHSGKSVWRGHPKANRIDAIKDSLSIICKHHPRDVRLFATVLKKPNFSGQDIIEEAFTQVCSRFDQYLMRLYRNTQHPERGLILFDKSSTEARIQTLARDFKYSGHQYGKTRNYADVPVFLDSKASRLIQLADLVAYAIFRNFEYQDSQFFQIIENCFDAEGGVVHGLYQR
jgi:hypothetical protein